MKLPAAAETLRVELRTLEGTGLSAVAEVLAQLPDPDDLAPGTLVVLGDAPKGGALSRLFRRGTGAPTAIRASALLARGYVAIEAGRASEVGDDRGAAGAVLVWGLTSTSRPSPGS